MVDFYSQFNPSSLSIKQFIDFGKLFTIIKPIPLFSCIAFAIVNNGITCMSIDNIKFLMLVNNNPHCIDDLSLYYIH